MLLPEDDYPIHQSALPLSHVMGGHPNAYDRFWFNGVSHDRFFAVALGIYPNRGVIDGAFSVLEEGVQHSVFASDALRGRATRVGPLAIDIVAPLRVNHISVDAPEFGLRAELTYTQRTATIEEPRQTMHDGARLFMDVTRATQLGTWDGWLETPTGRHEIVAMAGTKDRSWGVRPVGEPLPGAPSTRAPELCFFWAPFHLPDGGGHLMTFDDRFGRPLHRSAGLLPMTGEAEHVPGSLSFTWRPGTRWMEHGVATLADATYTLTPRARFHMRGAGYGHPTYGHGRWHGGPVVDGETLVLDELDPLDYPNIHVQHIVDVEGPARGLGVVEQLVVGPYQPAGLTGLLDGVPPAI
jgi:hypothetical protein